MAKPWPFQPKPPRSLLHWSPHFFLIVGILALGYVAFTLLDAKLYQADEARRFKQARQERQERHPRMNALPSSGGENPAPPLLPARLRQPDRAASEGHETVRRGSAWGRIEIASIGLSSMILE